MTPDRRAFLVAAIDDTEGTIRATDVKASIALVVHGLLLSALLSVVVRMGQLYASMSCPVQLLVVGSGGLTGVALLPSVLQLLRCVSPTPASAIPATDHLATGNFFVAFKVSTFTGRLVPHAQSVHSRLEAFVKLDDAALVAELYAELEKVSGIRSRKTQLIRIGILFLTAELVCACAFLAIVGLSALAS